MTSRPSKRQRVNDQENNKSNGHFPAQDIEHLRSRSLEAATSEEKRNWKGFCEIESEPAFFQVMLKELGVKGVKVREIWSLDEELLIDLPAPVYGLIFLFRWQAEDPDEQDVSCPPGIWFAKQTVSNACASVAILNIVNNVPGLELGSLLQEFKEATEKFSPDARGDAIGRNERIRQTHNSFARKSDMLQGDLKAKSDAAATNARKKRGKRGNFTYDTEAAFHFNAFVPVHGQLWKLDGLKTEPTLLGKVEGQDWLSMARPVVTKRMEEDENGTMNFALLALCRDSLVSLIPELASNIKTLNKLLDEYDESLLGQQGASRTLFKDILDPSILLDECDHFGVNAEMIKGASVLVDAEAGPGIAKTTVIEKQLRSIVAQQAVLRTSIRDGLDEHTLCQKRADERRQDYSPFVRKWLEKLSHKDGLNRLVDQELIPKRHR